MKHVLLTDDNRF